MRKLIFISLLLMVRVFVSAQACHALSYLEFNTDTLRFKATNHTITAGQVIMAIDSCGDAVWGSVTTVDTSKFWNTTATNGAVNGLIGNLTDSVSIQFHNGSSPSNLKRSLVIAGANIYFGTTANLQFGSFKESDTSFTVAHKLKYTDGNQSAGNVLTSDANGNASWQTPNSGILQVRDSVSHTQINGCHTSPVTLIASPGVGKFIQVLSVVYHYVYSTSAYSTGVNLSLNGGTIDSNGSLFGDIQATSSAYNIEVIGGNGNNANTFVNQPLVFTAASNPTGGGASSYVVLYITYQIVTF